MRFFPVLVFYDSYKTRGKVSSIELLHSRLDVHIASNPSESYVNGREGKWELQGAGRELGLPQQPAQRLAAPGFSNPLMVESQPTEIFPLHFLIILISLPYSHSDTFSITAVVFYFSDHETSRVWTKPHALFHEKSTHKHNTIWGLTCFHKYLLIS